MRDKLEVQAVISKCSILTPLQLCIYEMGYPVVATIKRCIL